MGCARKRNPRVPGTLLLCVAVGAVTLSACSGSGSSPPAATLSGAHLPAHASVSSAPSSPPVPSGLQRLSVPIDATPSGPLAAPAMIRIALNEPVPAGDSVVAGTTEFAHGPWTYLPATLSANRRTAVVTTSHFSIFSIFGIDIGKAVDEFKADVVDAFDSEATMDVSQPQCQNESGARAGGWSITSSTTNTVYWCFGLDGTTRTLKVTDDRRYPLEILHPDLTVSEPGSIDWAQLSSLSHAGSGSSTILAPGDTVTYAVGVPPGSSGGISTSFDGLGQSLMALQVGITTLIAYLSRPSGSAAGSRQGTN